jgi:hypothetical protein
MASGCCVMKIVLMPQTSLGRNRTMICRRPSGSVGCATPAAFDDVNEFVRFLHLHQDVATLQHLRRRGHGGQQLGLAALQQSLDLRPGQRGFG